MATNGFCICAALLNRTDGMNSGSNIFNSNVPHKLIILRKMKTTPNNNMTNTQGVKFIHLFLAGIPP